METKSTTHEQYVEHIAAWAKSGKSQKEYCHAHQLSYATFTYLRRRLRTRDESRFVQIKVERQTPPDNCYYTIEVPGKAIFRIHHQVSVDFLRQLAGCR